MDEKLYQEHLDEMFSINSNFTTSDIDRILNRLLTVMPNGGKLYKYRSIAGEAFENAYDSLENGYLWIPKANQLNDDEEAVVYYDPLKTAEEIADYIFSHPYDFLLTVINAPERRFLIAKNANDERIIKRACACLDKQTGKINKGQAVLEMVKDGIPLEKAAEQVDQVIDFVESWPANNMAKIEDLAHKHLHYNDNLRELAHIFSMSARYDIDPMWAYYANNNEGFCIEYDFTKVRLLSENIRRQLISVYRVVYSDVQEEFSFGPLLEWYLGGKNPALLNRENKFTLGCMLTKKSAWQHEQEWRIFLTDIENKLYADIVSGIVIDERALHTKNGGSLIKLAQRRGWSIMLRSLSVTKTKHIYSPYSTTP